MKPLLWIILTIFVLIILIAFIDYNRRRIIQSVEDNTSNLVCPDISCPSPTKCPDVKCPEVNPPDININNVISDIPNIISKSKSHSNIYTTENTNTFEIPEEDLTLFDATPNHILKYKAISSKDILVQKLFNLVSTITHEDVSQDEFDKHTLGNEKVLQEFYQYYHKPTIYYAHEKEFTQGVHLELPYKPTNMFVPPQNNSERELVYYQTKEGLHQRISKPTPSINDDMRPNRDLKRKQLLDICKRSENYQIRYYKDIDITAYQNKTHNASYLDKVILNRYKASSPYVIVHVKGIKSPFIYQDKWYWVLEKIPL